MVETSVSLSATHHGEPGRDVSPHAFTRFESVLAAIPATSETRLLVVYTLSLAPTAVAGTPTATSTATSTSTTKAAPAAVRTRWVSAFSIFPPLVGITARPLASLTQKGRYRFAARNPADR